MEEVLSFQGSRISAFHPGIYAKGGLEFEFGSHNRVIKAMESRGCT